MSDVVELLVKGARALPQAEQDALLAELLRERLAAGGGLPPAELVAEHGHPGALGGAGVAYQFGLPRLTHEPGGPWHTVPVRLSAEQHEGLKQWCQANNFTMAVVLRGLVARFLDAERERPPRQPRAGQA